MFSSGTEKLTFWWMDQSISLDICCERRPRKQFEKGGRKESLTSLFARNIDVTAGIEVNGVGGQGSIQGLSK
jgi:hypothetical protein